MKKFVTFLQTGEITWTSKSGRTEERRHVRKGTHLIADKVTSNMGHHEIWQGNWSVVMNHQNVRIGDIPQGIKTVMSRGAQ